MSMDDEIEKFRQWLAHSAKLRRVVLTGRAKSGTTWLGRILAAHPKAHNGGERKLLDQNGKYEPLLRPLATGAALEGWDKVTSLRSQVAVDKGLGLQLARVMHEYLEYQTVDPEGLSHLVEKVPFTNAANVEPALGALHGMFPSLTVIHIVRDGRDTAVSALFHRHRGLVRSGRTDHPLAIRVSRHEAGEVQRIFSDNLLAGLATSWAGVVGTVGRIGRADFQDRWLDVRYEDLLAAPHESVRRIYEHVGLPVTESLIETVVEQTSFRSLSGGRRSGQEDRTNFFRKGVSGDWERYFTPTDRDLFAQVAGQQLIAWGYEASTSEWNPRTEEHQ